MLSVHYIIAFSFGLVTLFAATVLLFSTSCLRKLNLHLAGILAMIACVCLIEATVYSLYATKTYHFLRYYLPVDLVLASALPPMLYAYIKKLLHYRFNAKSVLLALAQLLPALAVLTHMAVCDNDTRIRLSTWRIENHQLEFNLLFVYLIAQSLWYCLRCARKLDKKNTQNDTWLYDNHLLDLRILRTAFWIILSFYAVGSAIFVLSGEIQLKMLAGSVFSFGGIYFLVYHSLWNRQLVYGSPIPNYKSKPSNAVPMNDEWGITAEELELAFRNTGIHLRPDCNIKSAAESVGLLPYQLDSFLGTHLQTTFSQYIHHLRIEDAKQKLRRQPDIDMDRLAQECGFGSKSSFYNAFKRHTGLTPMAFQRTVTPTLNSPRND